MKRNSMVDANELVRFEMDADGAMDMVVVACNQLTIQITNVADYFFFLFHLPYGWFGVWRTGSERSIYYIHLAIIVPDGLHGLPARGEWNF